jgi:hypothetical protein
MTREKTRLAIAIRLWLAAEDREQKDLAAAWCCSESTVARFLGGQAIPESGTMLRIFTWCLAAEKLK